MSLLRNGAQWASTRSPGGSHSPDRPQRTPRTPGRARRRSLPLIVATIAALLPFTVIPAASVSAADDYLLMTKAEIMALPRSGSGWAELLDAADGSFGSPDLCDQDSDHHMHTLAAAIVYARTGTASYGTKARNGVMAAIQTMRIGCNNATLSLGRQLLGYVLAADFSGLSGTSDTTFKTWLRNIRGKDIGGHSVWRSLIRTHNDAAGNWGAYAGASRIAADLYLGDGADLAAAAKVTQGFLGDRSKYSGFGHNLDSDDLSWTCTGSQASYTPVSPSCVRSGLNVSGAVVVDISRGGARKMPPSDPGIPYQLDSIQGLGMQVELLYRHGFPAAWGWSDKALKRMADMVSRSDAAGGTGWNETNTGRQMPWLLNKRYGTSYPRVWNGEGRAIGFTSWLYGSGSAATPPTTDPPTSDPPTVVVTDVRPSVSKDVSAAGVKTVVSWQLKTSGTGLKRYEFQQRNDGGSWVAVALPSSKSTMAGVVLVSGHDYEFRVRAVDTANRAGPWVETRKRTAYRLGETASLLDWSNGWSTASSSGYIGGKVRTTNQAGASVTFTFTGNKLAWVAPVGPTRGKARVEVDGDQVAVVDQYASSFAARRIVLMLSLSDGAHDVEITALGTSGRPTVALDAIDLLDPR
jgi:hypothetical protein